MDGVSFSLLGQRWDLVDKQMDAGLYVVKRTAQFIAKVAGAQKACVKEITKATENEKTKYERLRADKNANHVATVVFLQEIVQRYTSRMDEFQNQITQDVVKPLLNFKNEAQKRLNNLRKEHSKHQKKVDSLHSNVVKLHAEGLKHWAEMEKVKAQIAQGDPSGKHEKKLQSLAKKAQSLFKKYEDAVAGYRQSAQEHYDKIIVGLLAEMEKLERQRLDEVGNRLSLFAQLWNTLDSPLASTAELLQITEELDTVRDIDGCIRHYSNQENVKEGIPAIPEHLPCKSSDFGSDKWRRPDAPPAQRQLVLQKVPCNNNSVKEELVDGQAPQENRYDVGYGGMDDGYGEEGAVANYVPEDGGGDYDDAGFEEEDEGDAAASAEGVEDGYGAGAGGHANHEGPGLFVQAVYALNTDDPDNLTFEEGEVICVTSQDVDWEELQDAEPDWLTGYLLSDSDRNLGQFPSNYVVRCDAPPGFQ